MLSHYGAERGIKTARKHLGWYLETLDLETATLASWRARLMACLDHRAVIAGLREVFASHEDVAA